MRNILFILVLLSGYTCFSQGIPPLQNFSPSDYGGENQNWSFSQSQDKRIYVANSQGLLEYNGDRWSRFALPNESIVRSVKVIGDRVYTGGYLEFGYWQKNASGALKYTSLSRNISDKLLPDEEFWNILEQDSRLIFQSLNRIYVYNDTDGKISWVDTNASLPKVFKINRSVYFQRLNEGIYRIQNGIAELVFTSEVFRTDEVINIFERENGLLVLTRKNGFFEVRGSSVRKWEAGADGLLSEVSLYSGVRLRNNGFALGTISDGVILLDENGELQCHIDQSNGLRNNTVLSLFEDQGNNLWLGLDNGISYLNLNSPFRVYQDYTGLTGSVYAAVRYGEMLYLGTNQGLFYRPWDSDGRFKMIPGTEGQVWTLEVFEDTLFCGHHLGTFIIDGMRAVKISEVQGTWKMNTIPGRPGLLMQGTYDGLYVLESLNGTWRVRNKIDGFDHSARFFEIRADEIFVNHEYKGLFRFEVDKDLTRALEVEVDTVLRGTNSGLVNYQGNVLFSNREGIFKYDPGKKSFQRDSILSKAYSEDDYVSGKLSVDKRNGYLWVFSRSDITYLTSGSLSGEPVFRSIPLGMDDRMGIMGYENVVILDNGRYLFGTSNGYITVDTQKAQKVNFKPEVSGVKVSRENPGREQWRSIDTGKQGDLTSVENNIEIDYYVPEYRVFAKQEYQYQLIGIYDQWSHWSRKSVSTFENLPYGEYTFKVRARIGDTVSENTASYSFSIAKPWYLTGVAMGCYALIFIFGAIGIHRSYRHYYRSRQQEIIASNKREMALARAQNEKEIINLKNKQLEKEFRNKSNELAASTLSIIRKNELLTKVKEQLLDSEKEEGTSVKQIVRIIDKSIDQNDDWEMFVKAFNHADQKFLKKLKNKHPNLSPNDVKLCAYLRLNLSSKEIAPLLNISPRSVEIKRYRLRKKMDLAHDINLTDYILTL